MNAFAGEKFKAPLLKVLETYRNLQSAINLVQASLLRAATKMRKREGNRVCVRV